MITKLCSKCKQIKSIEKFYSKKTTSAITNSYDKDGLHYWCKECVKFARRKFYAENAEKERRKQRDYRRKNLELCRAIGRKSYRKNAEKKRRYSRDYYKKNREKCLSCSKIYWKENKEKIKIRRRIWRAKNRKRHNKRCIKLGAKRRARKRNLPSTFNDKDWNKTLEIFSHCCAYCGEFIWKLHQEHIIPVCKNGGYESGNIVPACPKCNFSKNDRDYLTWMKEKEYNYQDFNENMLIIHQLKELII